MQAEFDAAVAYSVDKTIKAFLESAGEFKYHRVLELFFWIYEFGDYRSI